ncbi:MAG: cobyrinate a,c-diamide synthase [Candidatus Dormibacteria bacterium]
MSIPVVVVGAAQSGAGKTTATLALIAGLRSRGLKVQPFKVGPDYLDSSLLTWAAGRECRNLDGWMLPEPQLLELFHRASRGADIAVVEGVMGLFDGRAGAGEVGSTAAIARQLGAVVVLVLDAAKSSRTVGAVAAGLAADTTVNVGGAILNRVAGERHLQACAEGLAARGITLAGSLRRDAGLALPERYLGLISASESPPSPQLRRRLTAAATSIDLNLILRLAGPAVVRPVEGQELFPASAMPVRARIAIALDRVFYFYYRDSLDLLEAWGAELVPFSPLTDSAVPAAVDGIYIGGGYPELFLTELASNASMLRSLRTSYRRGALLYAECGGAMYLGAGIEDFEGRRHRLAGLWPAWTTLRRRRLSVGYRQVRALTPNFLGPTELPGHEFHYSQLRGPARAPQPAWEVLDQENRPEGFAAPRLVASYIHLHLGSRPRLAAAFVDACRRG